ncbi:MAG: hypothetical protein N2053_11520, partial [Chitinispirillaceae bacterium]|nr:hypothetical protein [Chitinispirillaceae bacterium]
KPDIGCWEVKSLTWDISTNAGFQGGDGIWGVNNYWSYDGTTLISWPGAGYSANFNGSDGNYSITVSGNQYVDGIFFVNSGYNISSGTLTFTGNNNIYVESGKNALIGSVIAGSIGLVKSGNGTLT